MIYVGLDDTDRLGTPGTGSLARALAAELANGHRIFGVTRHQLLQDPAIPFTAKNSTNVVAIDRTQGDLAAILEDVADFVTPRCAEGSDPAVCVAFGEQACGLSHGQRCQAEVVSVDAAIETAAAHGIHLRSLGGDPCGMIGALAGVCLAASGDDGRFIQIGRIRELEGCLPVAAILESGVRRLVMTILAVMLFAGALFISAATHLRLPGHSIVLWMPALMAGRALCGYRGSTLAISAFGGFWLNASRGVPDGRVFGYVLAALVIEGIMILVHEGPGVALAILMGMVANLGKLLPKVLTIVIVGHTPHHNRATLPYMLVSYLCFGSGRHRWGRLPPALPRKNFVPNSVLLDAATCAAGRLAVSLRL